jgi:hypothetical protein
MNIKPPIYIIASEFAGTTWYASEQDHWVKDIKDADKFTLGEAMAYPAMRNPTNYIIMLPNRNDSDIDWFLRLCYHGQIVYLPITESQSCITIGATFDVSSREGMMTWSRISDYLAGYTIIEVDRNRSVISEPDSHFITFSLTFRGLVHADGY